MSMRSDRARRRAARRRNQRLFFILAILLVLATIGFIAYTAFFGDNGDAGEAQVTVTASGLRIEELQTGTGDEAQPGDIISVHYTGRLENGTVFDSSISRGQPYQFPLGTGAVIAGWDEGVAGMREGGKRLLTIPPELAYGAQGFPPTIPPNATLIFEVELLDVQS